MSLKRWTFFIKDSGRLLLARLSYFWRGDRAIGMESLFRSFLPLLLIKCSSIKITIRVFLCVLIFGYDFSTFILYILIILLLNKMWANKLKSLVGIFIFSLKTSFSN